jgi:hypothetical protein
MMVSLLLRAAQLLLRAIKSNNPRMEHCFLSKHLPGHIRNMLPPNFNTVILAFDIQNSDSLSN